MHRRREIRQQSKRNSFKIRNPDKPIKMGCTIQKKIGEKRQCGGYMITDHLVKVGKKTYTSLEKGKTYNIVKQLLGYRKGRGKLLVLVNGFPTRALLEDPRTIWNTRVVVTQRRNTAHFRSSHSAFTKQTKNFAIGYSKCLHKGSVTIIYWNDNNPRHISE